MEFCTGGRDGKLKTFSFNSNDKDAPNMSTCQNLKLSWLERLVDIGNGNRCILGFHSSSFVIHSTVDAVNVGEIVCGGEIIFSVNDANLVFNFFDREPVVL